MTNPTSVTIDGLSVSQSVLAQIVIAAANEVPGVAYVNGQNIAATIASFVSQRGANTDEHVVCYEEDDQLVVDVPIAIFFGYTFPEVAAEVREKVAQAIEQQTSMDVRAVNVRINDLVFPRQ